MSTPVTPQLSRTSLPPWVLDPHSHWVSAKEFARIYRRGDSTVQRWCATGYVLNFCIAVYQDGARRWWLRIE